VVVGFVYLCAPSHASAQLLPLTEAEALARLSSTSPRVRAITTAIDIARVDVLAAGRWPNPRVSVNRESVAGVTEHMFTVSQALPITGRRGLEVDAASALVDASSHRAEDALRQARADLRLAFAQLATAQVREQELSASFDRLRELAEMLAKREAAGDAAGFDRLRAERELLDVETDRAAARTDRARAQASLAAFFAEAVDPGSIVAVDVAAPPPLLPAVETLTASAEAVRGELLALRKEIAAAQLSGRAADRRRVPEPEMVAGTKSSTVSGGDTGSVIVVHASVPLFDRNRPERALAEARARQAAARAEAFRVALRSQITALRATVIERRETADRYRRAVISAGAQMERSAQVSYDAGERGILELLDAYRTASAARLRLAALDAFTREAEIELEFVSGWEKP
jgi:cobalt-zinc-cadmium efflux system outer membrane protein